MSRSNEKIARYLREAHAAEVGLVTTLKSQIAMTPRGSYRDGLEEHLDETRTHAQRVQERLKDLGHGNGPLHAIVSYPLEAFVGFSETLISQALALSKAPVDLVRGSSGEEKVLKNAKDACATEALEIATYTALERLAINLGDEQTAELAVSIRGDEERMLERIIREIPKLTSSVVGTDDSGEPEPSYDIMATGAADAARGTARGAQKRAKRATQQALRVPGVAQAEGRLKSAVASEEDLAIASYDSLTAGEIATKLPPLSQADLAKVDSYERKNQNRTTVLSRLSSLQRQEPWRGYDGLTVGEIKAVLAEADEQRRQDVAAYERAHKNRTGVLHSAQGGTRSTRQPKSSRVGTGQQGTAPSLTPPASQPAQAGVAETPPAPFGSREPESSGEPADSETTTETAEPASAESPRDTAEPGLTTTPQEELGQTTTPSERPENDPDDHSPDSGAPDTLNDIAEPTPRELAAQGLGRQPAPFGSREPESSGEPREEPPDLRNADVAS